MNISYYTIDDLRLPPKRSLRKGRSVEQYSTLEEALARYQSLPAAGIRVLGLTDGIHVLELVKCLPLFPDDQEGEDVLASDYSCFPLWTQEPEAAKENTEAAGELTAVINAAADGKQRDAQPGEKGDEQGGCSCSPSQKTGIGG